MGDANIFVTFLIRTFFPFPGPFGDGISNADSALLTESFSLILAA
jgi:hypothetical protein